MQVQATDADGAKPIYSWSVASLPYGASTPAFDNSNNNNPNVTFYQAGTYQFTATIMDPSGLYTTSSVSVTVAQMLAKLIIVPYTSYVVSLATEQFTAITTDQFGLAMASQPTLTWTAISNGGNGGSGTVSSTGLFTAHNVGPVTLTASGGGLQAVPASLTVTPAGLISNINLTSPTNSYTGNLAVVGQVDTYDATIPPAPPGTPLSSSALNISVSTPANMIAPEVSVYNKMGYLISSTVLAENSGVMTIQVPSVTSGEELVVYVSSGSGGTGAYNLSFGFASSATSVSQANGSLNNTTPTSVGLLQVQQTQVVQFVLSANTTCSPSNSSVEMIIRDCNNNILATMTVQPGLGQTCQLLLVPGIYSIQMLAVSSGNAGVTPSNYSLTSYVLTNPTAIKPVSPASTTQAPAAPIGVATSTGSPLPPLPPTTTSTTTTTSGNPPVTTTTTTTTTYSATETATTITVFATTTTDVTVTTTATPGSPSTTTTTETVSVTSYTMPLIDYSASFLMQTTPTGGMISY